MLECSVDGRADEWPGQPRSEVAKLHQAAPAELRRQAGPRPCLDVSTAAAGMMAEDCVQPVVGARVARTRRAGVARRRNSARHRGETPRCKHPHDDSGPDVGRMRDSEKADRQPGRGDRSHHAHPGRYQQRPDQQFPGCRRTGMRAVRAWC